MWKCDCVKVWLGEGVGGETCLAVLQRHVSLNCQQWS